MNKKLEIPCSYQGGKQRLSKQIVDIFYEENKIDDSTQFYDICCGSGAISMELINRGIKPQNIHMVDKSPWGLVWQMIGDGSFDLSIFKIFIDDIPKDITKIKQYASNIISKPVNVKMLPYHFLFLQACAFGSTATWVENNKWCKAGGLRDYWLPTETSNRKSPVNPMMPMPHNLYRRIELLCEYAEELHGCCMDVFDFIYLLDEERDNKKNKNIIIYIDPPYQNTQQYGYSFNVYELESQIWNNVPIYISEAIQLQGAKKTYLLSSGRTKGNINGNSKKKPVEEWLNKFEYK
ncbi:hypothetical protein IMSAGC013_02790 [Lachnospiraceae bacterium]|jgi:site-specific DNA-adenine methylase|nr:hypothetical protein IMSAGC013_02790 [Lachnospiraceae bacterium]